MYQFFLKQQLKKEAMMELGVVSFETMTLTVREMRMSMSPVHYERTNNVSEANILLNCKSSTCMT